MILWYKSCLFAHLQHPFWKWDISDIINIRTTSMEAQDHLCKDIKQIALALKTTFPIVQMACPDVGVSIHLQP